ncbi:helix-turn-helix domain-containing protein [Nocardia sp. NPDC058666]|uniref:MmyB family transcriptional regulator n=1 Tax=unclassified Nocardia TaxID=2637762 RepID=UPI003663429F
MSIPTLATTCLWIRQDQDLTREEAQKLLGFSISHLARIENGFSPHPKTLELLIRGYRLNQAMAAHLRDLAAPDVPLAPTQSLRTYVATDPTLTMNLDRLQARGLLAAYTDPLWNVLARNDSFTRTVRGIDESESIASWMFSPHSRSILVDPEAEKAWTVATLKATMGRYRTSQQAQTLVSELGPNPDAQRLWAASLNATSGRDTTSPLHTVNAFGRPISYQINFSDGVRAHHIQLITATPEPYSGPPVHAGDGERR